MQIASPARRRRLQFSLRSLLILTTLCATACGWLTHRIEQKRKERETVAAIREAWRRHLVLVFRGQNLSQDDQLRFASYFGELGDRRQAPEVLRSRAEGIRQDNEKKFYSFRTSRSTARRLAPLMSPPK